MKCTALSAFSLRYYCSASQNRQIWFNFRRFSSQNSCFSCMLYAYYWQLSVYLLIHANNFIFVRLWIFVLVFIQSDAIFLVFIHFSFFRTSLVLVLVNKLLIFFVFFSFTQITLLSTDNSWTVRCWQHHEILRASSYCRKVDKFKSGYIWAGAQVMI